MQSRFQPILRVVLFLVGAAVTTIGVDNAFGGIASLGWQGPTDFFLVVDETTFAVRDSHIRFISGVWLAMGLILGLAAFRLSLLKDVVIACSIMVFIGGLLRFTQDDTTMLLSSRLLPSLVMELVLFPLLAIWTYFGAANRITTA
jgi:hypothetical protein